MPTKNDITGAEIKTSAYSANGRKNHDRIFAKKPAHIWAEEMGVMIKSPDGFRWDDGVTMETPINYSEFQRRLPYCTVLAFPFVISGEDCACLFED